MKGNSKKGKGSPFAQRRKYYNSQRKKKKELSRERGKKAVISGEKKEGPQFHKEGGRAAI